MYDSMDKSDDYEYSEQKSDEESNELLKPNNDTPAPKEVNVMAQEVELYKSLSRKRDKQISELR